MPKQEHEGRGSGNRVSRARAEVHHIEERYAGGGRTETVYKSGGEITRISIRGPLDVIGFNIRVNSNGKK